MSVVSAADQIKYNAAKRIWTKPILNVEPLEEIANALVNDMPIYPLETVTVDNTSVNWLNGNENMLFRFEQPDGTIIAWGVLRYDNAASTFYPDVKSNGDFGYATNEGIVLSDNDIIRVYRNRPIWGMVSRVTSAGLQKKRWDLAYTNEGTSPPPVAIMGHDQQQNVDTVTSLATFSFDASDSYGWTVGETITDYLYTLPTGAVVTGGAVNTDSVTFTIPAGIYTVRLDIISSTGKARSGFRTIYANDTGSNKSFGETYPIEAINSDSTEMNGWSGQFSVLGDVSSIVYPGCKCHWYVPVYYDGSRLVDNQAFIDVFIGYLIDIKISTDSNQVKRSSLTFSSPLKVAQLLPSATQTFEEVTSPSTWTEVAFGLSDPAYAAYYILQYHTTLLDNHDFFYEDDIRDLRRRVFGFSADNIASQLVIVGQIMRGDVGCRSDGTITLTQEPSLKSNIGRNALDSKFIWTEESVRDKLSLGIRFRPQIAYLIMAAVAYDGNPKAPMIAFASKAPGYAQAQGVTKTNIPDISITVGGGAAELYAVAGHMYSLLNNPLDKLDLPVAKMFDIAEPADADWHVLNISETDYFPVIMNKFGVRWSDIMRMRPTRVTRQWTQQNGSWIKSIIQQNRVESFGQPGVFHPIYKGEIQPFINPLSGWLDGLDITMPDINIDFDVAGKLETALDWNTAWLFNDFGISGYSSDWNGDLPEYAAVGDNLEGDIVAQCLDGSGDGSGYLITRTPSATDFTFQYNLYENPDVEADPDNWTLSHSWTPTAWPEADPTYHSPCNIVSNANQTMIVSTEPGRVYYQYKVPAGAWSARIVIGQNGGTIYFGPGRPIPPVLQDGVNTWVAAQSTAGAKQYTIFKQSSIGGSWAELPNFTYPGGLSISGKSIPMIAKGNINNIYVTYPVGLPIPGPGGNIEFRMFRIDGSGIWTEITPPAGNVPMVFNAIHTSSVNIWMIGTDTEGNKALYKSTNSGSIWTYIDDVPYDWLYRLSSDNVWVLGGDSLLDVTINTFGTFHSRLGKWGSIGSIGRLQAFASKGFF